MNKIDLTAAELREFVRLWRTEPRTMAETSALRKLERRIPTFLPTTLALALAEAMEERDRLRDLLHRVDPARVELAGSEQSWERQSEELSQTVLRVANERDKALADLEAAREAIRVARDHVIAHRVLNVIPADTWNTGWDEWDELPAVRAAWESKS